MTIAEFAGPAVEAILTVVAIAGWYFIGRDHGAKKALREKVQEVYIGDALIAKADRLDLGDSQYWSVTHVAPNHLELSYEGSDLDYEAATDDD